MANSNRKRTSHGGRNFEDETGVGSGGKWNKKVEGRHLGRKLEPEISVSLRYLAQLYSRDSSGAVFRIYHRCSLADRLHLYVCLVLSGGPVWVHFKDKFDCVTAEWITYRKLQVSTAHASCLHWPIVSHCASALFEVMIEVCGFYNINIRTLVLTPFTV